MGFLRGHANIAKKVNFLPGFSSEEAFETFQIKIFDLINDAYNAIKTTEPFNENPDEPSISASLFCALKLIAKREIFPVTVVPEYHELTNNIYSGTERPNTAKRYDIYFENWNSKNPIEFGVEAKLLIENDFKGRAATSLIREYVSDAGMGKYINGIYKKRGCMVGYVVEGDIPAIIIKINKQIEKKFNKSHHLLKDKSSKFKCKEIYKSKHIDNLDYLLYHLMLHFNMTEINNN